MRLLGLLCITQWYKNNRCCSASEDVKKERDASDAHPWAGDQFYRTQVHLGLPRYGGLPPREPTPGA